MNEEDQNYEHPNDVNVLADESNVSPSGFFPPKSDEIETPEAGESGMYNPRSAGLKKEEPVKEAPKMEVNLSKETIDLIRSTGQEVPQQKTRESDAAYQKRVLEMVQPYAVDKETAKFLLRVDEDEDVDDEVLARMQGFVNKIVRNASGLARYQMEQELNAIRQSVEPMAQSYQQQAQEQVANQFLSKYEHLGNYQPLVQLAIGQLQQEGFNGEPDVVYAKVAERAEQLGSQMGISFQKGQQQQVSTKTSNPSAPRNTVPTMASMSRGGRTASSGESNVGGGNAQFIDPWRKKPITT